MKPSSIDGRAPRVLIVEDEPLLAFVLGEVLVDAGFRLAGVAPRLEPALRMIESGGCDVAILDVNLAGVSATPAASALAARAIPFLVLSGYSPAQQDVAFSVAAVRLQKPCQPETLLHALRSILPNQHP